MKVLLRKRVFLLLVLSFIAFLFFSSDEMGRWMYPIKYQDDIRASSRAYHMEPHLVAAIIRTETNYSLNKVSHKGALGLMQLMPDTAEWITKQAGFQNVTNEMLLERPDVSIQVGTWYLQSLHKQFNDNSIAAVAAYNAGPGNVKKWIDSGEWDGKLETADQIPFGETRHYVQRVIYYYNKYKDLYPDL
ncbi:lytic transglycosylase domain-containing protein [Paenibacillus protaetiae]|uniref:Lytic transglycosylase domain-containing protein n=1 Tax=Paenibacillus protaetiae TaxID=2509456 RepID=A0A4P6EUE5_9BACL|nr:lytic transglycosylase domain-containing protein [Paenibacillus protaetiae]QAY66554.1 lytic transglycosylase domain-containing protein [Paenibacillus protaetiae]